jgi:hypothetical protein
MSLVTSRLAVLVAVLAACGVPAPSSPRWVSIETVGILADERVYADHTEYILSDGRMWTRQNDGFRIAYQAPSGSTLFVAGSDDDGAYVLLVGGQDGLPPECAHAIGYGGTDLGSGVAVEGFVWPKAPGFAGETIPTTYPTTTRFCLDDQARISGHVDIAGLAPSSPAPE